jgi:hypothetical protein
MIHGYEDRGPALRPADSRGAPEAGHSYARRIDCCDSPGSRERSGGGRGAGPREAETYGVRARGHDVH